MKFFAWVILIVVIFACTWADDTCKVDDKTFKVGETYQPSGKCELYECLKKDEAIAKSCPSISAPPTCKVTEDDSKPYPECCPQFEC